MAKRNPQNDVAPIQPEPVAETVAADAPLQTDAATQQLEQQPEASPAADDSAAPVQQPQPPEIQHLDPAQENDEVSPDATPVQLGRSAKDLRREYDALSQACTELAKWRPAFEKEVRKRVERELGSFDDHFKQLRERKKQAFAVWQAADAREAEGRDLQRQQEQLDLETDKNAKHAEAVRNRQAELARADRERAASVNL